MSESATESPRVSWMPHLLFAALAASFVVADQWTKALIVSMRDAGALHPQPRMLGGLFHLYYAQNTGGAFGILQGESVSVLLLTVSAAAMGFIGWYYWAHRRSLWMRAALTFVAGGAVGNFIDRIRLGYVVDFIDVDIGPYQWPYFNLADSFICIGAGMLIAFLLKERGHETSQERADDTASS